MAKKPQGKTVKDPNKPGRIKQIRQSYTMTKQSDPRIGLILLGVFLLAGLAGFAVMLLVFSDRCSSRSSSASSSASWPC